MVQSQEFELDMGILIHFLETASNAELKEFIWKLSIENNKGSFDELISYLTEKVVLQ